MTQEKRFVKSKDYSTISFRCKVCANQFEGIVKNESGSIRLTCNFCGNEVVVFL